jgi:predicted RNase H-like nuclease (RuvC/YqgF family)
MNMAELYEALSKVENGETYVSTIKAEISKVNSEAAKFRTEKNEAETKAEAKINELNATIEELKAKGTGAQTATERIQKQLDDLTKKYEASEKARVEAETKRVEADIFNKTVAELTKGNAAAPAEVAKILVGNIHAKDDGTYEFTMADGKAVSVAEGVGGWLKGNAWAVKNTQNTGSGAPNSAAGSGTTGKAVSLADAINNSLNS